MVQGYVLARPEIAPTSFAQFRQPADRQDAAQPVAGAAHTPEPRRPLAQQRSFGRRTARP
jgi:hypothetical protein